MALTETAICNQALDMLSEAPLTDMDADATPESDWFVRNFDTTRDAELRKYDWKFAIKRVSITVNGTAPTFDWLYRYAVPADALRILPLRYAGEYEGDLLPYEIDTDAGTGKWILTDQATPLKVRYVWQVTDVTLFDPLFVEAFTAKLAMKGAHRFTGKQSMIETAANAYQRAISEARRFNAIEAPPERPYQDDVISVRYF